MAVPLDAAPDAAGGGRRSGEESGRLLDMLALSQTSPSQAASRREQLVLLADALAGLPEPEADVLWLYYADSLSFEAIGERLELSRKSVRGIWARGLKSLKRSLEGPPGGHLRYDDGPAHDDPQHPEASARRCQRRDDRLGEAIEAYLALVEQDQAPDLDEFIARYDDLKDDLRAAMEGLELVHGLVGRGGSRHRRRPGAARDPSMVGVGPSDRRLPDRGRAGPGRDGDGLRGGARRAGPAGGAKVLGTHAAPDSSARRRFLNEARTAAGLHHTHIVPVFDVGQVGGLCYYAMQRIEGCGLDRVIKHLRRVRPWAAGSGIFPSGPPTSGHDGPAGLGTSSFSSRFGHLWVRMSAGLLGRQPRSSPPEPGGRDSAGATWMQGRRRPFDRVSSRRACSRRP